MNLLTFTGRLGKDGELRFTGSGAPVLGFSAAMDAGYGDNKQTVWLDCSLWGKRAESLEPYLKKGAHIAASGELSLFEAESGKTYLKLKLNDITLLGERTSAPKEKGDAQSGFRDKPGEGAAGDFEDDKIPF
jgi:single-strand DNA-binding protein